MSDEDTAHLRLLLRKIYGYLDNHWRWGAEENADLVIVNPAELSGQIARNRAFSSGRRCAVYDEHEPLRDGETRLSKPLKDENLVGVLNGTSDVGTGLGSAMSHHDDNFYDLDTLTLNSQFELEEDDAAEARAHRIEHAPAPGLDEMLKPDSEGFKPQFAVPGKLNRATEVEGTVGQSARADQRVADSVRGFGKHSHEASDISAPVKRGQAPTPATQHTLLDYLRKDIIGGPAALTLGEAPPLTLDPKAQSFHTPGKLPSLMPYCNGEIAPSAWRRLTTNELAQTRADQSAQPYSRLVWLYALVRSGGRLASHLDPGGRYRLKRTQTAAEADFPSHGRIIAALAAPAKVNEIAATSGTPMAEVFDVINAYDAIGLIEMERRQPRHAEPEPTGLMARLRKPFGK
jgi:hypothetical protein